MLTCMTVRQAILCHADTTLEKVGKRVDHAQSRLHSPDELPDDVPHVDMNGTVGVMRTCKDWNHIKHWLEENKADREL